MPTAPNTPDDEIPTPTFDDPHATIPGPGRLPNRYVKPDDDAGVSDPADLLLPGQHPDTPRATTWDHALVADHYGIPTVAELRRMHENQAPSSEDVVKLLESVSSWTLALAMWAERNIPPCHELAIAIGPGGTIDETRGLLKAAVARHHPDQQAKLTD